jgi:hypothetical protein
VGGSVALVALIHDANECPDETLVLHGALHFRRGVGVVRLIEMRAGLELEDLR